MPIARVRTVLTGLVEGGGLTTHNFDILDGSPDAQPIIDAVGQFWDTCKVHISNGVDMDVQPQVDILDTETGDLVGSVSGLSVHKDGTASGNVMPPATQRLIRLRTGVITAGRRVQGRLFIPGAVIPASDTQTVPTNVQTIFNTAAAGLISEGGEEFIWGVWSRKNGTMARITSADTWQKYAVLRSRRD